MGQKLIFIRKTIQKTSAFIINQNYIYDKNRLNYLKGVYKNKIGKIEKGKQLCQEAIRLMAYFGAMDIANILQTEFDTLLQDSQP